MHVRGPPHHGGDRHGGVLECGGRRELFTLLLFFRRLTAMMQGRRSIFETNGLKALHIQVVETEHFQHGFNLKMSTCTFLPGGVFFDSFSLVADDAGDEAGSSSKSSCRGKHLATTSLRRFTSQDRRSYLTTTGRGVLIGDGEEHILGVVVTTSRRRGRYTRREGGHCIVAALSPSAAALERLTICVFIVDIIIVTPVYRLVRRGRAHPFVKRHSVEGMLTNCCLLTQHYYYY